MPNYSLLFASSLQAATDAALGWGWEPSDQFHFEFRRPHNNERVRFVPDFREALVGLRWNTRVYLVTGWQNRRDAEKIRVFIVERFFAVVEDPETPEPRRRKRDRMEVLRTELTKLMKDMP